MKTVDTSVRGVMAAEIHKHSHFCIESAKKFLGREFQLHKVHTVWKFQNFSITQILREINFGNSRSATSAILTYLEALIF